MFLTNLTEEQYEPGQIELPYTCLLIHAGRHRVLVDTGIGLERPRPNQGKLLSLLQSEGIEPDQIDTVILSHAHVDHIGGCLNDFGQPAFPNARFVMLRQEWDYWMSNPSLAELPLDDGFKKVMLDSAKKNLPGIEKQLDLISPETEIAPGIVALAAFGHSPGQMGLEISSGGHHLIFVADAFVLPLHLECPESIGATDHRPAEVVETRIRILEEVARRQSLVSASHFTFPGLGYVASKRNRWEWRAVPYLTKAREARSS
jgi:glyoxylase-like metal-dependent hydrolase (beta-lactamase superfamily II)